MSSAYSQNNGKPALACRRKGKRYPLPVEVSIQIADRMIRGVVRDITIDKDRSSQAVGISLMHFEPLSVRREYTCRPLQQHRELPEEFVFSVRWCRYFEDEAFISGGVIYAQT